MSHLFSAPQMDSGMATVTERTDGYYWRRLNGAADEHGPFATRIDAIADMELDDEPDPDSGDLDQVEFGIGGAAWMDPETGHPAEAAILRNRHPIDLSATRLVDKTRLPVAWDAQRALLGIS